MSAAEPSPGRPVVLDLASERERAAAPELLQRSGRSARTLIKQDALRVTLVVLGPGGEIADHSAEGPITVQPIDGRITLTADGREHRLGPGQLLALEAGVRHAVASEEGGAFLLTLALAK